MEPPRPAGCLHLRKSSNPKLGLSPSRSTLCCESGLAKAGITTTAFLRLMNSPRHDRCRLPSTVGSIPVLQVGLSPGVWGFRWVSFCVNSQLFLLRKAAMVWIIQRGTSSKNNLDNLNVSLEYVKWCICSRQSIYLPNKTSFRVRRERISILSAQISHTGSSAGGEVTGSWWGRL